MSGGGGFRGGGFGPRGPRRRRPGPDLQGNCGLRQGGLGGPNYDDPRSRGPGLNQRNDGPNSRMGGTGYKARGGVPSRGPVPNFNHAQRPPRHQSRPTDNWAPRGGSPHFSPWRGGCPQRFNGPPRPYYHGRGQGPYMQRFPYMQHGNFPQPPMQFPPVPEPPKPVEQKPAIPHLGSEEERQQKITEAADALKRKLSAVAKEPDVWRDDDDEGLAELSRDADHDSRITSKGIPELKHDPPELNLTIGDLRDIGRVDHDHRTEQAKTNSEINENLACDESEVEILAHNPVRPMIEIDLWSDDNYGEYGEDECGKRTTDETDTSNASLNTQCDVYPAAYNFQSYKDDGISYSNDITLDGHERDTGTNKEVETAAEQGVPSTESVIEGLSETTIECTNEEPDAEQQIHPNRSDECDEVTPIQSKNVKTDAKRTDATIAERNEIRMTNSSDHAEVFDEHLELKRFPEKESEVTNVCSTETLSEIRDETAAAPGDNLCMLSGNETVDVVEKSEEKIQNDSAIKKQNKDWAEVNSTSDNSNTRISRLESLYANETTEESSDVAEARNDNHHEVIESAVAKCNIDENNISHSQSGREATNLEKETKESRKEVTGENVDKTAIQHSEVCMQFQSRTANESKNRKGNTSRETRYDTTKAGRDYEHEGGLSGFGDKVTNTAKPDVLALKYHKATVREQLDEREQQIEDNVTNEASRERNREQKQERPRGNDNQNKTEKVEISSGKLEPRTTRDFNKKTDSRDKTEAITKINVPKEKSEANIEKSSKISSSVDKRADDREAAKQEELLSNKKTQERQKLVRKMAESSVKQKNRSTASTVVPAEFDPREPPPILFTKNFEISKSKRRQSAMPANFDPKLPPPIHVTGQDIAENPQIPPAFDPRLSAIDRNALFPTGPSISSPIPVTQDFGIQQGYPPCAIGNFGPLGPSMNYGPAPIVAGTNVEPPSNIPPICLNDPYTTLLSLPNVPVVAPIAVSPDNAHLVPPLPAAPPPPPPPQASAKSNLDMDAGLEDMQEAMEFAKQFMCMNKETDTVDETNSADSDFFHMPTFPNLPPVEMPMFSPEVSKVCTSKTTINRKSEKSRKEEPKLESNSYLPRLTSEELRKDVNCSNETGEESKNLANEQERSKVVFNINTKTKVVGDSEWHQQQNQEAAAEAAAVAMSPLPRTEIRKHWKNTSSFSPVTTATSKEKNDVSNIHETLKKSRNASAERCETKTLILNDDNLQTKKPIESPSHLRLHSPIPVATLQAKQIKIEDPSVVNSEKSGFENISRRVIKESTSKKLSHESPESMWKNRVIGRFLKMSKNDICNMLNNTGLRKFDIAMKHLVKERRSSLSLGMRNNQEEKLKDTEASYNREEFMDQLSAMLDPSATVDVCNLPTQFIHHLSEVLQLESMSDFQTGSSTPPEHVEAQTLIPPQQAPQQAARLSKESANAGEIDDRSRPSKRGREKKSMHGGNAVDTVVATTCQARPLEPRRALKTCEESVEAKCTIKREIISEEVQKQHPAMNAPRARHRHHNRSSISDQPESSATTSNGSTSHENSSSLNMADLDDIFKAGIAKAKKKTALTSKDEKMAGEFESYEVISRYKEVENETTTRVVAKEPSVEGVERAAVELDKIFTAGIAKAKLASKNAAAAAAKAGETNDADDDEDHAGWKHGEEKSNLHADRPRHRPFSRHNTKCEKWNRRKAREDPDAFRNLTKEEWEAKYSENSGSTYERECRALADTRAWESVRSPTNFKEDHESYAEECSGHVSRLDNVISGDSGLTETGTDCESRRLRYINADCPMSAHSRSSQDDGSSSSTTTSTTCESSEEDDIETSQSVTKLLKVIKVHEKVGRKKSANEEIRDEVPGEIERKHRERGKVSRKGHKSRTKKSHRRKKDKKTKVRERKKRDRRRKKRKSRRSGSEERGSSANKDSEEECATFSALRGRQHRQPLIAKEIKKDNDVVVINDESESEQLLVAKPRSKSALAMKTIDDCHLSSSSSVSSMQAFVEVASTTCSPLSNQTKTKAQLKQLPVTTKRIILEFPNDTPKKQKMSVKEDPKENTNKVVASQIVEASSVVNESTILSQPTDGVPTSSSVPSTHPPATTSDELPIKTNAIKLDINTYKERAKLRLQRENEKLRVIHENPSLLTQDLLNIPLTPKKTLLKTDSIVSSVEQFKDPTVENNQVLANAVSSDTVTGATMNKTAMTTTIANPPAAKNAVIATAMTKIPIMVTTIAKIPSITSVTTKIPAVSTTSAELSESSTTTMGTSAISSTTAKTSDVSTTITNSSTISTTSAKSEKIGTAATTPSTVASAKIPVLESSAVQPSSTTKIPTKKLNRVKKLPKIADAKSTLTESRADVGKFAHIKSEGRKELKLREKLKKVRQRVSSDALQTTIPLIQQPRVKKRPIVVTSAEQLTEHPDKQEIEEAPENKRCDYFKKGVASDALPDIVPQEFSSVFREEPTKINELLAQQPEIDDLPITELSSWPLDPSISTSIADEIDSDDSPPFKGFAKEPILRRDRVLTEAEITSEIDALNTVPLAFEAGADALPISTVVDLNDLRTAELPPNEPISYGDEEFVEGRVEMETTLLGFSVPSDIPDDPDAIATLGDEEFVAENINTPPEKIPEESCESFDILSRVTSTLSDSPATVDLLIAEVQRRESIPSPLLVTESAREENEESLVTDLPSNSAKSKKKMENMSCDDAAEVTSSHETHNNNDTGTVFVEAAAIGFVTDSSAITNVARGKNISFEAKVTSAHDVDNAENAAEAQEMLEKTVIPEDTVVMDNATRDTTLETLHTPPPQPSSSSDSTNEKGKEISVERRREASESIDNKTKKSSHHSHSKSKIHSHGKNKRKSNRYNESKMKKKAAINEKMVEEAIATNIVKLVSKPTSKETVMARMIEIDVEIHKLMNEKMTLYKMLESGEFPAKDVGVEASSTITNTESRTSSEREEISTVLASRLVHDLDKAVHTTHTVVPNDSSRKMNERKNENEDVARKRSRTRSPPREVKNQRAKNNDSREGRRKRKNSESKSHSRRTTSEESSTLSREKSTSSTEPDDLLEEKSHKQKTKSLQRCSPIRQSSMHSHEHSSKEDLREGFRESTELSVKPTKEETRDLPEENAKSKLKKKTKNLEAKKTEETTKAKYEEKKESVTSNMTEKVETTSKKSGDGERSLIYSDESTWDSLELQTNQGDEQRGKKEGGATTGLALLEESFKREIAETRKFKAIERGKAKQKLRRILLDPNALTPDSVTAKDKLSNANENPSKVWKHVSTVIDAVAENRVDQLYNDDTTSSEPRDSVQGSSPIRDSSTEEKLDENVCATAEEATKLLEPSKNNPEVTEEPKIAEDSKPENSKVLGASSEPVDEGSNEVNEETYVRSDAEIVAINDEFEKTAEDNIYNEENTGKSREVDASVDRSSKNMETDIPSDESAKLTIGDNVKEDTKNTVVNVAAVIKQEENEENQSTTISHKSEFVASRENETKSKKSDNSRSPSPEVTPRASKPVKEVKGEKKREKKEDAKDQLSVKESISQFTNSVEKTSECSKESRRTTESEAERVRSKIRNGRSGKQSNVVLQDNSPKEKRTSDAGKHNSSKSKESKTHAEKSPGRPRSATKRRQRDKSAPPNRRNSRHPEDGGKSSRSKKREKSSSSRGTSPYEGEPSRKKANHSRRSSSPLGQVALNEDQPRRRGRKRRRQPEMSQDEMENCKVLLIDCKYTYLNPKMHPTILKKLGISKINPYIPPKLVVETVTSPKLSRVETPSPPILMKAEVFIPTKEPVANAKEPSSFSTEYSTPKERTSSPMECISSLKECTSSSMEPTLSPKDRPSSPNERFSSPSERPASPRESTSSTKARHLPSSESPASSKESSPSPTKSPSSKESHSSPIESPTLRVSTPSLKKICPSPTETGTHAVVDEVDDDEDDEIDDDNIQIVKVADEHLPLTSQSEDDETEGTVDTVEEVESVVDVAEEAESVVDVVEEVAVPPDSTADNIVADDKNEDNTQDNSMQIADTTDEVQLLGEKITIADKSDEPQELPMSEAEEEVIEPRRTRYTVHKGPILDIKVLDDSFLAASEDGAIYRYSQKSNGILNIYKGHEAAVTCIYVLEMVGKRWVLFSGSLDGTFRCYDIMTGLQERPPADVGSPVQCMDQAWGVIFVGTKSGHISRYNIKSGSIKGDRLEFSDKSVLALKASSEGPRRILIVAARGQPITIRDALTGLFLRVIHGHKNHTVYSLMRERSLVYCGTSSTSIPVFDFTNGEQVTQYNAGVGIVCMRLYRQILFAGCYDGNIYVFDTKETKLICSIPGPGNMLLSMEIVGDEIIAGSKNRQLHSWRMPRQVMALLSERT